MKSLKGNFLIIRICKHLVERDLRGKYKGSVDGFSGDVKSIHVPDDRVYGGIFRDYTQ